MLNRSEVIPQRAQGHFSVMGITAGNRDGFRAVYVFERLSRDLRSRFCALDTVRGTPRRDSDGSPVIPQFG
jgi:hypothetical protein